MTVRLCLSSGRVAPAEASRLLISRFNSRRRSCWVGLARTSMRLISPSRWLISSTARSISRANSFHLMRRKGARRMAREASTLARFSLAARRLRGFLLAAGVASTFSFICKFLPFDETEGGAADGQGGFYLGSVQFGGETLAGLLAGGRGGFDLFFQLL